MNKELEDAQREYDEEVRRFREQREKWRFPFLGAIPTPLARAQERLARAQRQYKENS